MQNIKKILSNLRKKMKGKKFLYPILGLAIIIVGIGSYYSYNFISKRLEIPQVIGANFSIEYRKIPFDTKTLEISFSTNLKKESITQKSITLNPFIEGKTELKGGNTLVYNLNQNLEIGQEYSLTVAGNIESEYGRNFGKDYTVIFEAISGAKVTKILPVKTLNNISQNIIVLFNIPMIPLTSLDNVDKLPCPVEITPKIDGKCKWTGGNVVEFVPTTHFQGATEYKITVNSSSGLLYLLKEQTGSTFRTPNLQFFTDINFSPKYGIYFRSNFPIDSKSLENKINLTEGSNKIPVSLISDNGSDTRYFIKPKSGNFIYSKIYNLSIPDGTSSKYGNIPTETTYSAGIIAKNFIQSADFYANKYSSTGVLVDSPLYTDISAVPNKNLFFKLTFDDIMTLDKSQFSITNSKGKTFDFDTKYGTESEWINGKNVEKESKKILVITIKDTLAFGTKYSLTILKKANKNLENDSNYDFTTVPEFKLTSFDYQNNTLVCVYFNNELEGQKDGYGYEQENDHNQKLVTTIPASSVRGIGRDRQNYETKQYTCPQKSGQKSYLLQIRLNPFAPYEVKFPANLMDDYGNQLGKDISFKVKTGDIKAEDKYIYNSFSKQITVIPSDVPAITDIQSINLDKATVEICEMNPEGLDNYIRKNYEEGFTPKCIKTTSKEVNLKNKYWTISNNKFDIEKDIAGGKIESPIYLIRSTINGGYTETNGKTFSNIVIRSNLSLTLESGENKQLIFASSYDGKNTPNDLSFEGFDNSDGYLVSKGKIKAKWIADKNVYELPEIYSVIVAKSDKYYGIVNINTDQTSNYDFKYVAGQDSSNQDFLYLYTERPIYKPGDTAFFKGLLRYFKFDGYHRSEVKAGKLRIMNENYEFFKEVAVKLDKNSNFSGQFELPKEMKTGRYTFEFYPDGSQMSVYNDCQFFVEEYVKPTFKINISGDKKDALLGDSVNINFNSEYYFGGRMTQAHYTRSIIAQNYFFDAKDYSEYQFGKGYEMFDCIYWGYCNYNDSTLFSDEGDINADGQVNWKYDFPKESEDENKNPNGEKIYNFNVTVNDPDTKKQVSNSYSVVLHNTDAYVGLKTQYYSTQKDGVKVNGIVLNNSAQPLSGKNVKIELIRREWKNVKKQGVDGVFYNDYSVQETNEGSFNMTSDSKGEFSDTLMTKSDGEYEVRATYTGGNEKSYISSAYVYVAGMEAVYWNDGNNTTTDLVADKSIMKIGETANFTLKSPVSSGKMFITVEKDDGIMDYFTQDIKSTGERISIPIKDNYYPNFYVKVFLIGKDGANPLPIFKRALSVIKIVTDYKKIKVSVKPAQNHYLPGDKIKLSIKTTDENGKAIPNANGSVSIVDESLLALKGNPKKNPFAFFYDMKRYLGIETYLSLFNLVEKLEVKDVSDGEKGGAGEGTKGGNSNKKRGVFKDTAFWQADFTTDKNGLASITTDVLPDNLTTWVIESVASTPDDNKIGVGETTIITTKKVIISENTPRFLGSNDTISLSPVIFNKTGKNSTFKITADATNMKISNPTQEININNGEQKTVNFEAKVIDIGVATSSNIVSKITFKAVSEDATDQDEVEKFMQIAETSTPETVATVGKTDSVSFTEKIDLTNVVLSSAKLVIRYAPTLLSNITSGMDFLARFPYGCIEQKQSAVMPNIYLKKLYNSVNLPFDLTKKMVEVWVDNDTGNKQISEDEIIKNYIAESTMFQKNSGGFGYWTDNNYYGSYADFHLTSLIVDGMSDIKSISYTINDESIKKAVSYLKSIFYIGKDELCLAFNRNDTSTCDYPESLKLEAINSILNANPDDYEAYKMYKLINLKDLEISTIVMKLDVIAKLLKNKNLSNSEKESLKTSGIELGNKIIGEFVVYNPRGAFLGKDTYNSRLLNTANFIGAVSDFGLDNFKDISQIIYNMNRWIISQKKDGSFGSTQENSTVIKNLATYITSSGELKDLKSNIKILLNGGIIDETNIDNKNKLEVFEKIILVDKLKEQNDFTINKQGNGKVYYDLSLSYYLPSIDIKPRDEGFYLEQKFYDYNNYRKIETLKKLEWEKYFAGSIDYDKLKYPKNVVEYLEPIKDFKVGQLVIAYNKIVTSEPRDQVAFEGYIPAGSELINTNLATENASVKFPTIFDREEFRDDRYFGFKYTLDAGLYEFNYVLRITHDGTFNLKPSQIQEFYKPEVFGRTGGRVMEVKE